MPVPPNVRQELVRLCSKEATRRAVFSSKAPTKWHPDEAYDPLTSKPYTREAAWDRVAAELATCSINTVLLRLPPGKTGYWFHFDDAHGVKIYVKLQLGSGVVMGRSFHRNRP